MVSCEVRDFRRRISADELCYLFTTCWSRRAKDCFAERLSAPCARSASPWLYCSSRTAS